MDGEPPRKKMRLDPQNISKMKLLCEDEIMCLCEFISASDLYRLSKTCSYLRNIIIGHDKSVGKIARLVSMANGNYSCFTQKHGPYAKEMTVSESWHKVFEFNLNEMFNPYKNFIQALFESNKKNPFKFVIAGGFMNYVTCEWMGRNNSESKKPIDIDVFVIGCNSNTKNAIVEILNRTDTRLHQGINRGHNYLYYKHQNIINIYAGKKVRADSYVSCKYHLKIITKKIDSLDDLFLFFDLDCCKLAFDGENVYTTTDTERSLRTGFNVLHPLECVGTADSRMQKYNERGFKTRFFQHPLLQRMDDKTFLNHIKSENMEHSCYCYLDCSIITAEYNHSQLTSFTEIRNCLRDDPFNCSSTTAYKKKVQTAMKNTYLQFSFVDPAECGWDDDMKTPNIFSEKFLIHRCADCGMFSQFISQSVGAVFGYESFNTRNNCYNCNDLKNCAKDSIEEFDSPMDHSIATM